VQRIDRLVSMSNLKYDALMAAGIEIGTRVPIPAELVPSDANVELAAKKAAGYFTAEEAVQSAPDVIGRDLKDF
jgi:GTP cyclohydrolase II